MQLLRSARWLLLALVVLLIPVSSHAGVFISVGFGPPALPVYEQPPCPQPGLMWTPGYWAYDPDQSSYYWVPGAWVPAPYEGALWTPGYWGWSGGRYFFHDGYWGPHVGYYGGVNYGFGYGGIGFAGGEWHGHDFRYNVAVVHVDRRYVHETFEDRGRVERGFVARDSHVAFSGGPGGIRHDPRPEERVAEHERHMDRTSFQHSHEDGARSDRNSFVKNNGGHPSHLVAERPLGTDNHNGPSGGDRNKSAHDNWSAPTRSQSAPQSHQENRGGGNPQFENHHQDRMSGPAPQSQPVPQSHQDRMSGPPPQNHQQPQSHPAPQSRPAPQPHPAPQSHPAPAPHQDEHQHGEHQHR
jgi:hypothetical protein